MVLDYTATAALINKTILCIDVLLYISYNLQLTSTDEEILIFDELSDFLFTSLTI